MAVVVVADLFESGGLEPVGLVDDEQLGEPGGSGLGVDEGVDLAVGRVVDGVGDLLAGPSDFLVDLTSGRGDGRGPQRCPSLEHPGRDGISVGADEALPLLPLVAAGVVPSGQGLADTRRPPADTDVAVGSDGVGELDEAPVLPGLQEGWPVGGDGWRDGG